MEIRQSFELDQPVSVAWDALSDVPLVAACLPGAELTDDLGDDRYKGKVTVKLGPILAAFAGEVDVKRDAASRSGTVIGKGADSRSGSRAQATMNYTLVEAGPGKTRVEMVSDIALSGALAQFGRTAIVNDIAAKLTSEFAKNLKERLAVEPASGEAGAPTQAGPSAEPVRPLDANSLVFKVVLARLAAFFRNLFGRRAS